MGARADVRNAAQSAIDFSDKANDLIPIFKIGLIAVASAILLIAGSMVVIAGAMTTIATKNAT